MFDGVLARCRACVSEAQPDDLKPSESMHFISVFLIDYWPIYSLTNDDEHTEGYNCSA